MNILVKQATVLLTDGPDLITVFTTLPCPFVKEFLPDQPDLQLDIKATYDTGIEYCRQHLGLDPEVTNVRRDSLK